MTPGESADRALTRVNYASGQLGYMVVKRKLQRWRLLVVIRSLKEALESLERIAGENR